MVIVVQRNRADAGSKRRTNPSARRPKSRKAETAICRAIPSEMAGGELRAKGENEARARQNCSDCVAKLPDCAAWKPSWPSCVKNCFANKNRAGRPG